jgi:hypothetical protein
MNVGLICDEAWLRKNTCLAWQLFDAHVKTIRKTVDYVGPGVKSVVFTEYPLDLRYIEGGYHLAGVFRH